MTRESRRTKKSSSIQTKAIIIKDADMPGDKIYVWNTYRKFHITNNQWHKDDTLTGSSVNGLAGAAQRREANNAEQRRKAEQDG